MGIYTLKKTDLKKLETEVGIIEVITNEKWDKFNTKLLGLGNLSEESKILSSITAVFDLEGFTNFCKQIDPQLSTPIFLNQFLDWFFQKLKDETMEKIYPEGIRTYHQLPLLTKFLGDGILVIWDSKTIDIEGQLNIIVSCSEICKKYISEFYPIIKTKVTDAPMKLRCGITKGNIFSVGNGNDYVGPCINFASRIQKLPGISFAFSDRGFNVEGSWSKEDLNFWVVKKVKIRGVGDSELIHIRKADFSKMTEEEKVFYIDP
ncbi:MAG: hypothetical protein HYZ42_04630 [Bacteroidetes bacterium]|nr:hypothetical protein [Bacteroidota bacterium]